LASAFSKQEVKMATSLKNNFLIAMPTLNDPFFHHSVVYLCEHTEQGAMGLITNRPTQIMLADLLQHIDIHSDVDRVKTTPVLFGGPVEKNQGMVLHDLSDNRWGESIAISNDVFLSSSTEILRAIGANEGPDNILVTLGYSSWDSGQLEEEISENSWLTVPADTQILFHTESKHCWQQAASLIGVDIHLMSEQVGHA
jgi:putative transcriptional regulator